MKMKEQKKRMIIQKNLEVDKYRTTNEFVEKKKKDGRIVSLEYVKEGSKDSLNKMYNNLYIKRE